MSEWGYIQVTRRCNQSCRFCSNPAMERDLDPEQAKDLVGRFMERGFQGIIFTGGEPTLWPHLPDLLRYCRDGNLPARVITNGQRMSDPQVFDELADAGLRNVNLSVFSVRDGVQGFLTRNPDSLSNLLKTLSHFKKRPDMQVVINTVINKYNSDHLSENIEWFIREAPFVRHFVWNNLDPRNDCVAQNPDTVARLNDFQLELSMAVRRVLSTGRTCRVERVPLCYMNNFEHLSTETRKIIKGHTTSTFFLDDKGLFSQDEYQYGKAPCCDVCRLAGICAGLFEMDVFYFSEELSPRFVDAETIRNRVLADDRANHIPGAIA